MERLIIGVHMPVFKRLPLLDVVLRCLRAVEERLEHEIVVSMAGPDCTAHKRLARSHHCLYTVAKNQPLGAKVNAAVEPLRGCDVLMGLGSDDLACPQWFNRVAERCTDGIDFIGATDCYFFELENRRLTHWHGYTGTRHGEAIGCGRGMSAALADALKWRPFDDDDWHSLDAGMMRKVEPLKPRTLFERMGTATMVDVKTSQRMNDAPSGSVLEWETLLPQTFGADVVASLLELPV